MKRSMAVYGLVLAFVAALAAGCTREETPPEQAKPAAPAPAAPAPAADQPVADIAATPLAKAPAAEDAEDPDYPEDMEELYVDLEAEPDEGAPPLTVKWTAIVEDGTPPYSYKWDFGDGSTPSAEESPTHEYKTEGDYTATLTVKDSKGMWGSEEYDVIVEPE
jgi:PKD repeat protein